MKATVRHVNISSKLVAHQIRFFSKRKKNDGQKSQVGGKRSGEQGRGEVSFHTAGVLKGSDEKKGEFCEPSRQRKRGERASE